MKGSFIKNLHTAFALSLTFIVIMAVLSLITIRESNERAKLIHHTELVIEELERLISYMKDAETGVRGFVITSREATLEPYHGSYEKATKAFTNVKNLTKDNPEQQKTLPELRRAIQDKYDILKLQIRLKRSQKVFNSNLVNEGKRIMDEARMLVLQMQQRENTLLRERTKSWEMFSLLTVVSVILLTLVAAISSYYFCRWLKETYFKKAELQRTLQQKKVETEQQIAVIEQVADSISRGNYHVRLKDQESELLGSLSISLNRMALSLEHSFREIQALMSKKDEFIGIAAHELKTPLTSIKAYLQYIGKIKFESSDAARVYPFVTKANNQVNRLSGIITDLLDVTRINERQLGLKLEKFSLRHAILEASDELLGTVKTHDIVLEGDPDLVVEADLFRIEQVLINLISNAIKYSPQSRRIVIEVKADTEHVRVSVTDFGIGIPEANLPFVFQRYFRVEVSSQHFSGMGLGLYISKGIIERHRGTIGVVSKEGAGTTFWFTLPFTQAAEA